MLPASATHLTITCRNRKSTDKQSTHTHTLSAQQGISENRISMADIIKLTVLYTNIFENEYSNSTMSFGTHTKITEVSHC